MKKRIMACVIAAVMCVSSCTVMVYGSGLSNELEALAGEVTNAVEGAVKEAESAIAEEVSQISGEAAGLVNGAIAKAESVISEAGNTFQLPEPTGKATYASSVPVEVEAIESGVEGEPYVPEDLPTDTTDKTILGNDDRIVIYDTFQFPYSAIAYISTKYTCGCYASGSGFMVSCNTLMTASHCMFCVEHNAPIEYADFYFGYDVYGNYYYAYQGAFTYYYGTDFPQYSYTSDAQYNDYCYVIFTDSYPGYTTGNLGLRSVSDTDLGWTISQIAGYRDGQLTTNFGTCTVKSTNIMSISMDTLPGNSGCPIFDSEYYAFGICISENNYENHAYRVNNWLIDEMYANGMIAN